MKPITTSLYDFVGMIKEGFVYVDKTAQIYELARQSTEHFYFLPRPRRFGKSLLLSTIKALFQGRRELFKGLAIDSLDWDWEKEVYPVLHLDMSTVRSETVDGLEANLSKMIEIMCQEFECEFDKTCSAGANFFFLLNSLKRHSTNGKFVLLIDEYDSPISGFLDSEDGRNALPKIRLHLHDFYLQAKASCSDCRFMMVTGVSKFSKTSIFSAFNNPKDLAIIARSADLLGYTHDEMEKYFHEHIQAFADDRNESYEEAFAELLQWYDSYQFSPDRLVKVINPVSFGNALNERKLRNYWEATAGSTLIFDILKASNRSPVDFVSEVDVSALDAADPLTAPAVALLYQAGYLTIDKPIDDETVLLKIPNNEVRRSLERGYISSLLGRDFQLDNFQKAAKSTAADIAANGFSETFSTLLKQAFALLPHDWVCKDEQEAKRFFTAFMVFAMADVVGEEQHATGRPDAVLATEKGIYIFEFKFNVSAKVAIKQCHDRNYASRFVGETRPVHYVGVNYNPAANVRNVDDVICESVDIKQE